MVRVYFEVGKAWVFACAVDYPGWQRRAKGEEAALETLEDYRSRYGEAVGSAPVGELHVVASLPGTMTTDFGAPDARGPWDDEPLQPHEVNALGSAWSAFDRAVAGASPELRKGSSCHPVPPATTSERRSQLSCELPGRPTGRRSTLFGVRPGTSWTTLGRSRISRSHDQSATAVTVQAGELVLSGSRAHRRTPKVTRHGPPRGSPVCRTIGRPTEPARTAGTTPARRTG